MTSKLNSYVKIEGLKMVKQGILYRLSYSSNLKRYFLGDLVYIKYDKEVDNVDKSILYVPAISALITFAWAVGANIYVEKLDETFFHSLNKVKSIMVKWWPKLPFSTKIITETVRNEHSGENIGLLFSGGIDSTSSYIRHRDKKPILIMIHGIDVPPDKKAFWAEIKTRYKHFASKENTRIDFIETNIRQFLNERLLDAEFGRYGCDFSWWGSFSHGITTLGLCAPLTIAENMGTLLIPSTHTSKFKYPWGSHPLIDENISWANVRIIHDGYELTRQEKIRYVIKKYIEEERYYPILRVCYSQFQHFNCNQCTKCIRSIVGLTLEGIDPNRVGFTVDDKFFMLLKQRLNQGKIKLNYDHYFIFEDIQRHIPETLSHNLYSCEEFFKQFRNYSLSKNYMSRKRILVILSLYRLYYRFPSIEKFLNYTRLGDLRKLIQNLKRRLK